MRQTVPIDILLSVLAGELCALVGEAGSRPDRPWGPPFRYALAFGALAFAPIGLVLQVFYPAWSWMYFLDPRAYSPLLGALAVYGYVLALVFGYALSARYCRGATARRVALAGPALLLLAFMYATFDRLWYVGTFDDFINGRATPLLQSSLAPVLALLSACFVAGLLGTLRAISRLQGAENNP